MTKPLNGHGGTVSVGGLTLQIVSWGIAPDNDTTVVSSWNRRLWAESFSSYELVMFSALSEPFYKPLTTIEKCILRRKESERENAGTVLRRQ